MPLALPQNRKAQVALALGAVSAALVAGGVAQRELLQSTAGVSTASERYGVLQAQARAHPPPHKVPYFGPFSRDGKHGATCGPAVRIMQGALRRTTPPVRKSKARSCIGAATESQLRVFQRRHRIPASGIYGGRTHRALAHAYSREQRDGLVYIAKIRVLRLQRSTVLIVTSHAALVGQGMRYSQSGSRSSFPSWPSVPSSGDCSSYVTWVLYQSGVGFRIGYFGRGSPVGWTGTLGRQGKLVPRNAPLAVGDLIFYGGGYPHGHVEVYIGHGRTSGHGSPGIHNHAFNYRPVATVRRMIFRRRKPNRGQRDRRPRRLVAA